MLSSTASASHAQRTLRVRRAQAGDIEHLLELFDSANHGALRAYWRDPTRPSLSWRDLLAEQMRQPDSPWSLANTLVAADAGGVAATLNFTLAPSGVSQRKGEPASVAIAPFLRFERQYPGCIHLRLLATDEPYRGQGLARALLDAPFRVAGEQGLGLFAVVHETNAGLIAHYRRRGLQEWAREAVREHPRLDAASRWILLANRPPQSYKTID